jgi:DHA1 family bicyclomycin/chloramphenicol resistance-like MFS transporter
MIKQTLTHKIIFTIILSVCAIVPLTNDIFISGIPEMSHYFSGQDISLVLSASLLGLAVAQIFYGPLLDRFGRKPVLITGLMFYIFASAYVMSAHDFTLLIVGRFFQALGVCSAIVSVLAIVRDTYKKEELIKATGLIMAILGAGPATAPLIGSFLNHMWGWRASFIFLFILGIFYFCWISIFLKETLTDKNKHALRFKNIVGNYIKLAKNSEFFICCMVSGFSYSVLFSYISLSALFIITQMHFSLMSFGIIVALNSLAIILMSLIAPHIARRLSLQKIMKLGLATIFISGLIMAILNLYVSNIYSFILPVFLMTVGIGMIRPTASAYAMQLVEAQIAGSAAAFFNFSSFTLGSLSTFLSSKLVHNVSTFGLLIAIIALMGLLILNLKKQERF